MIDTAQWLGEWTIRVGLLCAAGLIALVALRSSSAVLRHRLLYGALLGSLALPVLVWCGQRIPVATETPMVSDFREGSEVSVVADFVADSIKEKTSAENATAASDSSGDEMASQQQSDLRRPAWWRTSMGNWWSPAELTVCVWLFGVLRFLLWTLLSRVSLALLMGKAKRIEDGDLAREFRRHCEQMKLRRGVSLFLLSPGKNFPPMAGGIFRPWIGLPAEADKWSESRRSVVIVHELAHIRRNDCLAEILCRMVTALQWWNPLVWLAVRRLRVERENACDDLVLLTGADPADYADTIVEVARPLRRMPVPAMAKHRGLETRVRRILDRKMQRTPRVSWCLTMATWSSFLVVLPVAWFGWAEERKVDAEPPPNLAMIIGQVTDESRTPLADVQVFNADGGDPVVTTDQQGRFRFPLRWGSLAQTCLIAASPDRSKMGLSEMGDPDQDTLAAKAFAKLVLKPSHRVEVRVVDDKGAALSGAKVAAIHSYRVVAVSETGADGMADLFVPADAKLEEVVAVKPGLGFDYFENYLTKPSVDLQGLPTKVTLTLDGAATVRVRAVDTSGNPLEGVVLKPWFIHKTGKMVRCNFANSHPQLGMIRTTDSVGIAVFDYFPIKLETPIDVLSYDDFSQPAHAIWEASEGLDADGSDSQPIIDTILLRTTQVSGRVLGPDGAPVPGVLLRAEGRGHGPHYCRSEFRTDADGRFSVNLDPEQSYLIAVTDPDWAAPSIRGLIVRENQPVVLPDFALTKGTLVHGFAKPLPSEGLADQTVTVIEQGEAIDPASLRRFLDGFDDDPENPEREGLVRWASTDAKGHYSIRLGPGTYEISADMKPFDLLVAGEEEIQIDLLWP